VSHARFVEAKTILQLIALIKVSFALSLYIYSINFCREKETYG
jgi:hypothetical protein